MVQAEEQVSPTREEPWRVILRLRWLLGGVIALAFALGRLIETMLLQSTLALHWLALDVTAWGLLGGSAVWLSLTWVSRQERGYRSEVERALQEQQNLNRRLQRANMHLSLLSEVNRRVASSATLDEILDAALFFPQRLFPARAAALLLCDASGPVTTRIEGATNAELAVLREQLSTGQAAQLFAKPQQLTIEAANSPYATCLVLPLRDQQALIGWLEFYLPQPLILASDEQTLLETIANEIAEAIVGARRRSREERAIYQLERAIAEERARIARDIHDGVAQGMAFRRMRIALWLDWLETDRERLREELIALKITLREQIAELRRAIFALRPVHFDELGFAGGLNRYIAEFATQQGWTARVDLGGVPPALSLEAEAIAFRVVQEALNNAAKHAQASEVEVCIGHDERGLLVVVRDNGRGFAPEQLAETALTSVGLRQMHERLAAVQGQLVVHSRPGAGTEIRAQIPLKESIHESDAHLAR